MAKRRSVKAGTREQAARAGKQAGSVDEFVAALDHPLKAAIDEIRGVILGVSPEISEGIKWNSVSFKTHEFFATVNLRSRDKLQLVFHLGAKKKDNARDLTAIKDPAGLLKWLSTDRALVTLGDAASASGKHGALRTLLRAWIKEL